LKRVFYDPLCLPSLVVNVFFHDELQIYVNNLKTSFEETGAFGAIIWKRVLK